MGGGDADAVRRAERLRREFNRLRIQPQGTSQQFNSSFLDPRAMPQQFDCFNGLVFQPDTKIQLMTQEATLFVRRVYVGGLPPSANEQTIGVFFNQVMAVIGGNTAGPGDAVCSVCINHEQRSALVVFGAAEEASNAMALDGILFEGVPVKVRRPADYNSSQAAAMGPSQPSSKLNLAAVGLTAGSAGGGLGDPDSIFLGGLPYHFTEAQVQEFLQSFGPLREFELVKDRETGNSKGYASYVYMDTTVTDIACAGLNGINMGDRTLTARRANQSASQPRPEQESILLQAEQQVQLQFNPLTILPQVMPQQATRHARRVCVGGLPPSANEETVAVYFNLVMAAIGGNTAGPGDAVLKVYINHDKKLAFLEMRSVEEASNAMALDGIMFEGAPVNVRRPTDYNPSLAAALGPSQPSPNLNLAAVGLTAVSTGGLEGPDRIFVGGLPYYSIEAQVRELLETFGPLRGFLPVKDRETGNSKGYAFCVYEDLTVMTSLVLH